MVLSETGFSQRRNSNMGGGVTGLLRGGGLKKGNQCSTMWEGIH